jgi:hypothetical protein
VQRGQQRPRPRGMATRAARRRTRRRRVGARRRGGANNRRDIDSCAGVVVLLDLGVVRRLSRDVPATGITFSKFKPGPISFFFSKATCKIVNGVSYLMTLAHDNKPTYSNCVATERNYCTARSADTAFTRWYLKSVANKYVGVFSVRERHEYHQGIAL